MVALPCRIRSTISQPITAAAVATWVLTNDTAAVVPALSAEPALKPNQPNHSSAGTEQRPAAGCAAASGPCASRSGVPSTMARASAAAPAFTCTAVPPAKSSAFSLSPIKPPLPSSRNQTECATGKYTRQVQPTTNAIQPRNVARSAMAPEISAGVMIANISWKATKASVGIVPLTASGEIRPARPTSEKLPITCPVSPPNVSE